jgi:hypothetical protein
MFLHRPPVHVYRWGRCIKQPFWHVIPLCNKMFWNEWRKTPPVDRIAINFPGTERRKTWYCR